MENEKEQFFGKAVRQNGARSQGSGHRAEITDGGCCYSQCGLNRSLTEMEPIVVSVEVTK